MTEQTLAVVIEPPETGAGGHVVSPSITETFSTGTPRCSAAVWAATVVMPLPISCVAVSTRTVPSGRRRTRALAGPIWVG